MSTLPRTPGRVLRLGTRSLLWSARPVVLTVVLLLAATAAISAELLSGRLGLPAADVLATLAGRGSASDEYAVYELRLPRALTAALAGLALGGAGAAFQTLVRNPLGSPDVIGVTTGSATGALLGLMLLQGSQLTTAGCSLAGGLGCAAVVYWLARRDGVEGYRLVLLGVGLSAVLMSVNAYLVTRADLEDALAAQVWLTGSLAARGWEHVVPLGVVVLPGVTGLALLGRALGLWVLGADTARALGLRAERVRLVVVVAGVVLVASATTATGPIAFVALVAPHVARLAARTAVPGVLVSACTGAVLLLVSDLVATRISSGLPVGVVTSCLGGAYLALLLVREWKVGRG